VTTTATHKGTFVGIPATGRTVTFGGIVIYRVAKERIAETWSVIDFAGLLRQLK
jgi:predicted ester cyclase